MGGIGPRSTPTIHDSKVYALGATGVLRCLELSNGKLVWQDDLRKRYGISAEEELLRQHKYPEEKLVAIGDLQR